MLMMGVNATAETAGSSIVFEIYGPITTQVSANYPLPSGGTYAQPHYMYRMPLDITNRSDTFAFWTYCVGRCFLDSVFITPISTHYRVTERKVYPNADVPTVSTSSLYTYSNPKFNDSTTSSYTNLGRDYVHAPKFTEFRGHGTVRVTQPDGTYSETTYNFSFR